MNEGASIQKVWDDLGGGRLQKVGAEYRGAAFWRDGDNPRAVSIDVNKNVYYDHVTGTGGGTIKLVSVARGVTMREAGDWIRQQYGPQAAPRPEYSQIAAADRAEAPQWLRGFIEHSEDRLGVLKARIGDPAYNQDELAEHIQLLTRYNLRLRTIQTYQQADGTYPNRAVQEMVELYRMHRESNPQWAAQMVEDGRFSQQQARAMSGLMVARMQQVEQHEQSVGHSV